MNNIWNLIDNIIDFVLVKLLKLKINKCQKRALIEFIKFGIVGLSNTIISYVIYLVVLIGLQKLMLVPKIDYLIAQFIAFVLSVLWSFYWNNKYVFKKEEHEERNLVLSLMKTYVSYAFSGLFLNSILSLLWVEVFGWSKMIAPIINLLLTVPINFILNKFWAFKKK